MDTEVLYEDQFTVRGLFEPQISARNLQSLYDLADNECTIILTANQRQTRHLQQVFAKIEPPNRDLTIASYEQWVSDHYKELCDQYPECAYPHLISAMQKNYIWEQITRDNDALSALIDRQSIAKSLQEAHSILLAHKIDKNEIGSVKDLETEFMLSCIESYEQYLHTHSFISNELLPQKISEIYEEHQIQAKPRCYLYGFAEVSPVISSLLSQIAKQSYSLIKTQAKGKAKRNKPAKPYNVCCFENIQSELKAASLWAKNQVKSNPDSRIAIVAPNLTSIKQAIETQLLRTFDPQHYFSNTHFIINKYFDISAAEPLSYAPIIDSIFLLLEIRKDELDKQTCQQLCRSPFWGHNTESNSNLEPSCFIPLRLKVLNWIKAYSSPTISSSLLIEVWDRYEQEDVDLDDRVQNNLFTSEQKKDSNKNEAFSFSQEDLFDSLDKVESKQKGNNKKDSQQLLMLRNKLRRARKTPKNFSAWITFLKETLEIIAWPGKRIPNTYEYQQLQRFFQLLQELQTLDLCPGVAAKKEGSHYEKRTLKISFEGFVHTLKNICQNTSFHMQTNDGPLSVLGLMESSCLPFDACWILHASDDVLPSSPNPNPFIPFEIQKKYQTPRSSDRREYEYAKHFVNDLNNYCTEIIVSYSRKNNDSLRELSPLFTDNDSIEKVSKDIQKTENDEFDIYCEKAIDFNEFKHIATGQAPKIPKGEKVNGGSGHISLFGVNPFYAYLRYRLGVLGNHSQSIGYTSLERGNIVHEVLEKIYTNYNNQNQLQEWFTSSLYRKNLYLYIDKSLFNHQKKHEKNVPIPLFDAEKDYLFDRITSFIKKELKREPFKIIATEATKKIHISGYTITLRVDRIDAKLNVSKHINMETTQTNEDNHSLAIFDYKTSSAVNLSGVRKSPLTDAQLPLYTLIDFSEGIPFKDYTVDAVVYTQIAPNQIQYHGLADIPTTTKEEDYQKKNNTKSISQKIHIPNLKAAVDARNKIDGVASWNDLLRWWKEQVVYSIEEICSGNCRFVIHNQSKAAFHEDLLIAVRDEERKSVNKNNHNKEGTL